MTNEQLAKAVISGMEEVLRCHQDEDTINARINALLPGMGALYDQTSSVVAVHDANGAEVARFLTQVRVAVWPL